MKIRIGFISNSSTSSFIVALPKIPHSVEEVKTLFFGHTSEIMSYDNEPTSTMNLARLLYDDIVKYSLPLDEIESLEYFSESVDVDYDSPMFKKSDGSGTDYDLIEKYQKKEATPLAEAFFKKNKGKYICVFTAGNEISSDSTVIETEADIVFRNFDHVVINQH
jgi:hypothetical protein